MAGNTLFNVSNPVNPHDVLTKDYADYIKGGGWVKKIKMVPTPSKAIQI